MKLSITAAAILLIGTSTMTHADDNVQVVPKIPTASSGGLYTANRAPLAPSPLVKLPIGAITPKGWLRHQLELERDGMTGHLAEISPWCKFEGNAWASPQGKGHNGWEEMPYWLKGYGDLGYVLNDERIIARGPPLDRRACSPAGRPTAGSAREANKTALKRRQGRPAGRTCSS